MKVLRHSLACLCGLLLFTGCGGDGKKAQTETSRDTLTTVRPTGEPEGPKDTWSATLNQQPDSLHLRYTENAILLFPDGSTLQEGKKISEYYRGLKLDVAAVKPTYTTLAGTSDAYRYETGIIRMQAADPLAYLVIVNLKGDSPRRELEYSSPTNPGTPVPEAALEARRARWMELCNAHQVEDLVKELYWKNALYYNHKPPVFGHLLITEEYAYMKAPDYHLELAPLHLQAVDDSTVFEIGQCSGSYGGKYVLLWKKDPVDGQWRILMDSNI